MPKNSILVLDNCRIHKTLRVLEICQEAGVLLEFLPAYSPIYNPIELDFLVLKAVIKREFSAAGGYPSFNLFLMDIVIKYSGKHAPAQFRHCGYNNE